jgi:hypothetical protein
MSFYVPLRGGNHLGVRLGVPLFGVCALSTVFMAVAGRSAATPEPAEDSLPGAHSPIPRAR